MSFALSAPVVYLITKGDARPDNFDEASREILGIVRTAVEENVPLVQIREKRLTARLLFELAKNVVEVTRGTGTRVLVNDRADIATATAADGVHLTSRSLSADRIRKIVPPNFLIGVSTHSVDDVRLAAEHGADFVLFGPVFESPGKAEAAGMQKLAEVCETSRVPVLAVGGIDKSNMTDVLALGPAGFAAIRALNDPASLREIVRSLSK